MDLVRKRCAPCEGGVPPLQGSAISAYLRQLKMPWQIINGKKLMQKFKFRNFKEVMAFANAVAEISEKENHHPNMHLYHNNAHIELWTHAIGGLSENDFIMAAKIEALDHL